MLWSLSHQKSPKAKHGKPHISIRCCAGSHTSPLRNGYQLGIDRGTWPCPWNIWNQSYFWSTVMACDGMWRGLWNNKTSRWILLRIECIAWNVLPGSFPSPVWNTWFQEFRSYADSTVSYSIFRCRIDEYYMSLKTAKETIGPFSHALHSIKVSTQSQLQRLLQTNTRLVAKAPRWQSCDTCSVQPLATFKPKRRNCFDLSLFQVSNETHHDHCIIS